MASRKLRSRLIILFIIICFVVEICWILKKAKASDIDEEIETGKVEVVTGPTQRIPQRQEDYGMKLVFSVKLDREMVHKIPSIPRTSIEKLHIKTYPCPYTICTIDGCSIDEQLCIEVWDE